MALRTIGSTVTAADWRLVLQMTLGTANATLLSPSEHALPLCTALETALRTSDTEHNTVTI